MATGSHVLTIEGADGVTTDTINATLTVFDLPGSAPTLLLPADGATDVSLSPQLSWSSVPGVLDYTVEIDDDPAFGSIDYTANESTTSHTVQTGLSMTTTYYWRVRANNTCGSSPNSIPFEFTTGVGTLVCNGAVVDFNTVIPADWQVVDNEGTGVVWGLDRWLRLSH